MILIWIAIILVIVIILLWRRRKTVEQLHSNLHDVYDSQARELHRRLLRKRRKTSRDFIMLGDINRFARKAYTDALNYYMLAVILRDSTIRPLDINRIEDFFVEMLGPLDPAVLTRPRDEVADRAKVSEKARKTNRRPLREKTKALVIGRIMRSDSQNVHDTTVNDGLRRTFEKLRELNGALMDWSTLAAAARARGPRTLEVVERMATGGPIVVLGADERDVVLHVWTRIHSPDNARNRKNLLDAFFAAIDDMRENGHIVCQNGRAARILGALALIDADKSIGTVVTEDMIRKEIFDKAGQTMMRTLAASDEQSRNAFETLNRTPEQQILADAIYSAIKKELVAEFGDSPRKHAFIREAMAAIM